MLLSTGAAFAITCNPGFFAAPGIRPAAPSPHVAFTYRPRFSLRRARARGADRRILHGRARAGAASYPFVGHRGAAAWARPAAGHGRRGGQARCCASHDEPRARQRSRRRSRRSTPVAAYSPDTTVTVELGIAACPCLPRDAAQHHGAQSTCAPSAQCIQPSDANHSLGQRECECEREY